MIHEAVSRALSATGLSIKDIDSVVIGNMEHFEGIHLSDLWAIDGSGGFMKPTMKVATGGCTGSSLAIAGYYHVASGMSDLCLAIGWEKLSESGGQTTTGIITAFDPFFERPAMAGAVGSLGSSANAYISRHGIDIARVADVVVETRRKAARNPHAHLRKELTKEQVLDSPMISYPIRLADMCPTSDGACAVILGSERAIRRHGAKAAYVQAVDSAHNRTYIGDVSGIAGEQIDSLKVAAIRAYKKAGIKNPIAELDVAEIYEPCSYALLQWMEYLGFADPGRGIELFEEGTVRIGGKLEVNPSGGVMCTNPIGATGLIRVAEATNQILGRAGPLQIDGVRRAMSTGFGGSNWNEVLIYSKEPS
jgi:acetyl-CoA C-acetyltransferase